MNSPEGSAGSPVASPYLTKIQEDTEMNEPQPIFKAASPSIIAARNATRPRLYLIDYNDPRYKDFIESDQFIGYVVDRELICKKCATDDDKHRATYLFSELDIHYDVVDYCQRCDKPV